MRSVNGWTTVGAGQINRGYYRARANSREGTLLDIKHAGRRKAVAGATRFHYQRPPYSPSRCQEGKGN